MTDDQRLWAIRRIRAKRAFWVHLTVYILVNTFLVFVWATTAGDSFWPVWPMFGWGIGLAAHAATVFLAPMDVSDERIERELRSRDRSATSAHSGLD